MLSKESLQKLALFFLICLMLPYILNLLYIHPSGDDFTYAVKGKEASLFNTWVQEYNYWNGRYISNIFVLVSPLTFNSIEIYRIIPIILIVGTFLSIFYFLKTILKNRFSNLTLLTFSLIWLHLYLVNMPIISEGIYWYTGAITYQLGVIFYLILISLILHFKAIDSSIFKRKKYIILICIFSILTIGMNEIAMILTCLTLILFLFSERGKMSIGHFLIATLIISCSLLVYFAPGNSIRALNFNEKHDFLKSFFWSGLQCLRFLVEWVVSPPILIASICFIQFNSKLNLNNILPFIQKISLLKIGTFILLLIFVCIFPAYWSTGMLGQHRTINVAYFFFLPLWFLLLQIIINKYSLLHKYFSVKKHFYFTLFTTSLLLTNNLRNSILDLHSGKSADFDKQMLRRYQIIKEEKSKTIYLSKIQNPPKTIFVYDIHPNPQHWLNRCYLSYFDCQDKKITFIQ
jgi:hypothetical protein